MQSKIEIDSRVHKIELHNNPIVVRVNKFNEESAQKFARDMNAARNSLQPYIPIVIDSYGGQVYSLMSMISEIKSCEVPVVTIVEGKAMSCGAVLFSFGTEGYRFMAPDATVMIHDVSSGCWGKIEELKADIAEAERLDEKIFTMMARNCGKKDDYFKKKVFNKKHADWFMDAEEAKKHGLVNHLRVPKLNIKVDVDIDFD